MKLEPKVGVMWPQAQEARVADSPQELGEAGRSLP